MPYFAEPRNDRTTPQPSHQGKGPCERQRQHPPRPRRPPPGKPSAHLAHRKWINPTPTKTHAARKQRTPSPTARGQTPPVATDTARASRKHSPPTAGGQAHPVGTDTARASRK